MYDMTGFQRDLLYVAASEAEPNGLELKDKLEQYYEGEIHTGGSTRTSTRSSRRGCSKRVRPTGGRITIR